MHSCSPLPRSALPPVALGTWAIGGGKAWGQTARHQCIQTIHAAVEAGCTLIDTAPAYGAGEAEKVVGEALRGCRALVKISTKCGLRIDDHFRHCADPQSIRRELDASLRRLGTDFIDLLFLHYPDPNTPVEESVEELLRIKDEGIVGEIGLSNHGPDLLQRACLAGPIDCLQGHFSLLYPRGGSDLFPLCRKHAIVFLAYGCLGGGLLTGKYRTRPTFSPHDARSFFYPFFREPDWSWSQKVLAIVKGIAHTKGCHPEAIALAWVLGNHYVTTCIVGARKPHQIMRNASAARITLSPEERTTLDWVASESLTDGAHIND